MPRFLIRNNVNSEIYLSFILLLNFDVQKIFSYSRIKFLFSKVFITVFLYAQVLYCDCFLCKFILYNNCFF